MSPEMAAQSGPDGRPDECPAVEAIVLQKSFWADQRNFLGPLMRFARGDVRGPHRLSQNRPRTFVSAPKTVAALEASKNHLLRDFRRRSIFDFCNSIPPEADITRAGRHVRFVPISEIDGLHAILIGDSEQRRWYQSSERARSATVGSC
jgi:hypothetical protein